MDDSTKKLLIIAGSIIGVLLIILLVTYLISKAKPKAITYEELESKLVEVAKKYYADNNSLLPSLNSESKLYYGTLESAGYIDPINEVLKNDDGCMAYVLVKNFSNEYYYMPYVNCGSNYRTVELYNKILEDNEITSKNAGLYQKEDMYYFRGDLVNNYVMIDEIEYRILRINEDDTISMIASKSTKKNYGWDNRYNTIEKSSHGINDFEVSRLKETLKDLETSYTTISDNTKGKLTPVNLCIGKRKYDETSKDNSVECSVMSEDKYLFGVITVSDFMMASLDDNCISYDSRACSNYNFLSTLSSSYTLTAASDNTYKVYYTSSSGIANKNASGKLGLNLVLTLSNNVLYASGNGTKTDPYMIK